MKIERPTPASSLPPVQHLVNPDPQGVESAAPAPMPAPPASERPVGHGEFAASRSDRVEISDEARSRAAQLEEEHPAGTASAEKPSIDEIRQRIQDGVYETNQAIDSIARRILERGDL